jgi:hypothetical protein
MEQYDDMFASKGHFVQQVNCSLMLRITYVMILFYRLDILFEFFLRVRLHKMKAQSNIHFFILVKKNVK